MKNTVVGLLVLVLNPHFFNASFKVMVLSIWGIKAIHSLGETVDQVWVMFRRGLIEVLLMLYGNRNIPELFLPIYYAHHLTMHPFY